MASEKIRLGGMALQNGVLVHGPTAWAAAVRAPTGELKVAGAKKRFVAARLDRPVMRGPARLVEAIAILPDVRRRLPEARLPFERPAASELASGLLSFAPAAYALRGSELAAYHGAEHVSIGSYEHGEVRAKEHERCGSHLLGPFVATSVLGGSLVARLPRTVRGPARAVASLGALAAATELFAWMVRNPERPLAK